MLIIAKMKIVITGFNGFVGRHASRKFRERGYEIHGVSYGEINEESRGLVDHVSVCDLSDPAAVNMLEIDSDVDAVLNLAGFATNTGGDAELIHRINVGVHANMCRRLGSLGLNPTYIGVSSSTVYLANQALPLTEDSVLKDPANARPYEASKIMAEQAMAEFPDARIIIARPFNHIGPGQGEKFLIPDLAKQVIEALKTGGVMKTGNLTTKRDYTNVEDVILAYIALAELTDFKSGEVFNICSGRSISGEEMLAKLLLAMRINEGLRVEVDPSKLRGPSDVDDNYGSYAKLHVSTGWSPTEGGVDRAIEDVADEYLAMYGF